MREQYVGPRESPDSKEHALQGISAEKHSKRYEQDCRLESETGEQIDDPNFTAFFGNLFV